MPLVAPDSILENKHGDEHAIEVQFVLLQNFSLVSFTGAIDSLVTANLIQSGLFTYSTIGAESNTVPSDVHIDISANSQLQASTCKEAISEQLKVLVVCGGYRCTLQENPALSAYLNAADRAGVVLCSLWNGSIHLAHAGLLNHQKCALHPENHAYIKETYPEVELSSNNFVVSQKHASCSGPVSAIEMMLGVIKNKAGDSVARAVREIICCDKPSESQDSTPLQFNHDSSLPTSLKNVLQLMRNNVEEPLSLKEISNLVSLSSRQLERLFQRDLGTTPTRFYLEIRVSYARQLLLQSNKNILDIAIASGFITTSHFSNCFKRIYGITPTEARSLGTA